MLCDPVWDDSALQAHLTDPDRGQTSADAMLVVEQNSSTGTAPVLFVADDHKSYWAKWPGNPHGEYSLANEWIVSQLAVELRAPFPTAVLLNVNGALVSDMHHDGVQMPAGTWFGSSRVVGIESDQLLYADRAANIERVPYYLALWHLCFGRDQQFVYDYGAGHMLYSIDHGLWFDCCEGDWDPNLDVRVAETWLEPDPGGKLRTDGALMHAAADTLEALDCDAIGRCVGSVPLEWQVPDQELARLARFVHARRQPAADHLRFLATRTKGATR